MTNTENQSPRVTEIIAQLADDYEFETDELLEIHRQPSLITELVAAAPAQTAKIRLALTAMLIELGCPALPEENDLPERFGPHISSPLVVKYLIDALTDEDLEIRTLAGEALANEVPDFLLRNHTLRLIDLIRENPGINNAVLLLGKTGAEAARRLLVTNQVLRHANPPQTQMALGRLGDRDAEQSVIAAFFNVEDPRGRANEALRLGYMATPKAILTLAREMRTPVTYVWKVESKRSMRVHIIEGLNKAFPTEPVFWRPFYRPEDDSYYDTIENWITENLGVTWDQPRPAFLYQEDAPNLPDSTE